jgi:hypothetical protein
MTNLADEFRDVFSLYIKLGIELTRIMDVGDSKDPQVLIKSILQNRDCLERITQMNSRVVQLSDTWVKCRNHLDPKSRSEVHDLVASAKAQAVRLQELCSVQTEQLRRVRDDLGKNLAEIGKGSQFLKSIKPVRNNYPKFVDSLY